MRSNVRACDATSIWSVFDGVKGYLEMMSAAKRVVSFLSNHAENDVACIFMDYLDKIDCLGGRELLCFCISQGLCCNAFDFLNLRASVVVRGEDFYADIMGGDYSRLNECAALSSSFRKMFYEVVSGFFCVYFEKTEKLIHESVGYTDEVFLRLFDVGDFGASDSGKCSEVNFPSCVGGVELAEGRVFEIDVSGLGVVRVGDFLRHLRLGIFWIYRISVNPNGEVKVDAMHKDDHRGLYLTPVNGLVTRI